jgi:hypothetical protein
VPFLGLGGLEGGEQLSLFFLGETERLRRLKKGIVTNSIF